jgi:hypothetical protein
MLKARWLVPAGTPDSVNAGGLDVHRFTPAHEKLSDIATAAAWVMSMATRVVITAVTAPTRRCTGIENLPFVTPTRPPLGRRFKLSHHTPSGFSKGATVADEDCRLPVGSHLPRFPPGAVMLRIKNSSSADHCRIDRQLMSVSIAKMYQRRLKHAL